MQGQLRETITDINQSANQLGVTSEELHAVTDQSARIMQQQSLEVDLAVTAVTELTSAIEEVAQSADRLQITQLTLMRLREMASNKCSKLLRQFKLWSKNSKYRAVVSNNYQRE